MKLIKQFPNPFLFQNGEKVQTHQDWEKRRNEIVDIMLNSQYGTMPAAPEKVEIECINKTLHTKKNPPKSGRILKYFLQRKQLDGVRSEQIRMKITPKADRSDLFFHFDAELWLPSEVSIQKKQEILPSYGKDGIPVLVYVGRNNFPDLLKEGYAILSFDNNQLQPAKMGKPEIGIVKNTYEDLFPGKYSWGSIAIWAWGALRLVDYVFTRTELNSDQIIISGHSRNGKASLLAGAVDQRIEIVNPAGSGCAGAGSYLALGDKCEDLAALTDRKRWWDWAHPDFGQWAGKEITLPFDQHFLMGAIAPRPLLRVEGTGDTWANPKGTACSFLATEPIYKFLGAEENNAIAFRKGGHTHNRKDRKALVKLADRHFFNKNCPESFKALPFDLCKFPPLFDWINPSKSDLK